MGKVSLGGSNLRGYTQGHCSFQPPAPNFPKEAAGMTPRDRSLFMSFFASVYEDPTAQMFYVYYAINEISHKLGGNL